MCKEQSLGKPKSRAEEPSEGLWLIPTIVRGSERGRDWPKITQQNRQALDSKALLTLLRLYHSSSLKRHLHQPGEAEAWPTRPAWTLWVDGPQPKARRGYEEPTCRMRKRVPRSQGQWAG